jgi:hypothetical protein
VRLVAVRSEACRLVIKTSQRGVDGVASPGQRCKNLGAYHFRPKLEHVLNSTASCPPLRDIDLLYSGSFQGQVLIIDSMAAPMCKLRTRRPTPTTASFVVSTASPINSITDIFLHYAGLSLRFILACVILLVLEAKWDASVNWSARYHTLATVAQSPAGRFAIWIASRSPTLYLVPGSAVCLWLLLQRGYTGERIE